MINSNQLNIFMFGTCYLGILMLLGKLLRVKVKLFQNLFLPASLIGGILGIIMGPDILGIIPQDIMSIWSILPSVLITIVFACVFLGSPIPKAKETWEIAGPQIVYSYIIYALQWIVGLALAVFLIKPLWEVDSQIGTIIQVGWTGGHGAAAGMIDLYKNLGFSDGGDLALTSATIGLIFGIIFGIILINVAVRKKWTSTLKNPSELKNLNNSGINSHEEIIAKSVFKSDSIEPFAFHVCIIGVAIVLGKLMLDGIMTVKEISLPLFPIAMIAGIFIQYGFVKTKKEHLINKQTINRVQGTALDFLVISAVATVNLSVIVNYLMPLLVLMLGALATMLFITCYIAPRFFKDTWFERAIVEFGTFTGVLAVGLLLLRIVDPKFESNAAKAVALERPFVSPVTGVITALLPVLMVEIGIIKVLFFWMIFVFILILFSMKNKWLSFKCHPQIIKVTNK